MSIPSTMKALVLTGYESALKLKTLPVPAVAAGQVLVKIMASGVNPLDIKIIAGKAGHAQTSLPAILGMDMAGVIVAIGYGVHDFKVGDEVYGMTGGIAGVPGSLAEYAAVDQVLLARKPRNISMHEAAAIPLVFITAWEGLIDRARLDKISKGSKVLVHGGAGGVGHMAVQIALAFGADVYATGEAAHKELIESFGVTAIDFRASTVDEYVALHTQGEGFDIVYDTVGGATLDASFNAVKAYHGHVVSCLGWGQHSLAPLSFRAATYSGVFTLLPLISGKGRQHHGDILRHASRLIVEGKVKVLLDGGNYTLETVNQAHVAVSQGKAKGKVVIGLV